MNDGNKAGIMARSIQHDGIYPERTRIIKSASGKDVELPYCNICEEPMDRIRISALLLWQPGFKWTRKFPLKLGAYLCDPCREKEGFGPEAFMLVPCALKENGQAKDMIESLKDYIALMEKAATP